jgi:hypothetical protein
MTTSWRPDSSDRTWAGWMPAGSSMVIAVIGALAALLWPAAPVTATTEVYILSGQSNMVGWGVVSELSPPYSQPQPAVRFWSNGGWVSLQGGFAEDAGHFGPEVGFGARLHELSPANDIYLVKYAIGGTSLAVDWNPNGTGACYNALKVAVASAMTNLRTQGRSPVIAGMTWMQGEQDTGNDAMAAAYAHNLTDFIAKVRSDLASPDMPFVLGRIIKSYGSAQNNALVRAAQETVPSLVGNAASINTDDLQIGAYANHFGTQGQISLGIRFADQIVQLPEPTALGLVGSAVSTAGGFWCWKRWPAALSIPGRLRQRRPGPLALIGRQRSGEFGGWSPER